MKNNLEKEPISIYLPTNLAEQLDDLLFSLRKRLPRYQRKQLTKSIFYELIMSSMVKSFSKNEDQNIPIKIVDDWAKDLDK